MLPVRVRRQWQNHERQGRDRRVNEEGRVRRAVGMPLRFRQGEPKEDRQVREEDVEMMGDVAENLPEMEQLQQPY